jgi:hypothetical protein
MEIEFDASEYELIAVAIDDYLRKLRRERRNIKQFLKKLKQLFNSSAVTAVTIDIVGTRTELRLLNKDMQAYQAIKERILPHV